MDGAEARHRPRHRLAWHRAECWSYTADLELWRQLVGSQPRRVLDLGCGAGRVAIDLANQGHRVTGLDHDPALIEAVCRSEAGVEGVIADVRSFDLKHSFGVILAPMQMLQLLTEPTERAACLACVRRHLSADGLFAAALVEIGPEVPPGDLLHGHAPITEFDDREQGLLAASTTTGLILEPAGRLRILRQRQVYLGEGNAASDRHAVEIELALLSRQQVRGEFEAAGIDLLAWRSIPATETHMGSVVAIGRAACQSA